MAPVSARLRSGGRRLVNRVAPSATQALAEVPLLRKRVDQLQKQLRAAQRRLDMLQAEVQESRRLQLRVAELTDIVAEVIIPAADRDDERLHKALEEFQRTSF